MVREHTSTGIGRRSLVAAVALGCLPGASASPLQVPVSPEVSSGAVVITGATLVDPVSGRTQSGQGVVVRGDRIVWTGPDETVAPPADAVSVDVAGRFLVPGLVDMHVHVTGQADALFVANGVTTVRRMHGNQEALEWRASNRAGDFGPRVFVAGPLLAGGSTPWGHELQVESAARAASAVARVARAGYDYVKIYDDLQPEVYAAITAAARQHGLATVGHVPVRVGLPGVIAGGQRTLEHIEQLLFAHLGRDGADLRYVGVTLEDGAMTDATPHQVAAIAAELAGADVWVTPTLAAMRRIVERGTEWYEAQFDQPGGRYSNTYWPDWWAAGRGVSVDPGLRSRLERFYQAQVQLVGALQTAGVPLLAGTDTAAPLVPAGYSIHDELDELVTAGLTPLEALRAATSNAAAALGVADEIGTLAPGASADLIVVDGDPLQGIDALREPYAVMVRGEWYARERLDAELRASLPR